ncbi:MAG: dihydrofolate reductase [Myxococcota bacterium]|nr:dihydrofolate reductase [Myxococcota bacterium]
MKKSIIVAMDNNRVIGKNNTLPWHLPADLAYFKRITMGKPIIMGRKTYESIGRPLPGRKNVVLTQNPTYQCAGCIVVDSLDAAWEVVDGSDEVMVIGGATLFERALEDVSELYITHVDTQVDGDTFFPDWDDGGFELVSKEKRLADSENPFDLSFCLYRAK